MRKKYREIFHEFKPYRLEFILGPAAKLFEAILELFLPILMGKIVDTGFSSESRGLFFGTPALTRRYERIIRI